MNTALSNETAQLPFHEASGILPIPQELSGYHIIVPIVLTKCIDSKTAQIGDRVEAFLKEDLKLGGRIYVNKGAMVYGHIASYTSPRTLSQSLGSDRRFNSRAALSIQFDEIVDNSGRAVSIEGLLSEQSTFVPNGNQATREIKVDNTGQVIKAEPILSPTRRNIYTAGRALTVVPLPGGLMLNVLGVPAAMGIAGGADPNFAYNKPVDPSMQHKHLKGMMYAFVTNLPGAFFVQAIVEKGDEIELNSGDELVLNLCLRPENTAVTTTPMSLTDVHGTILPSADKLLAADNSAQANQVNQDNQAELIAQTARFDDSLVLPSMTVSNPRNLILPDNGGNRLIPAQYY